MHIYSNNVTVNSYGSKCGIICQRVAVFICPEQRGIYVAVNTGGTGLKLQHNFTVCKAVVYIVNLIYAAFKAALYPVFNGKITISLYIVIFTITEYIYSVIAGLGICKRNRNRAIIYKILKCYNTAGITAQRIPCI